MVSIGTGVLVGAGTGVFVGAGTGVSVEVVCSTTTVPVIDVGWRMQ